MWVPTEAYRAGGGISVSVSGSFDPPHGAMIPADGLADARAGWVFAAITSSSVPIPLHACLPEGPYCYWQRISFNLTSFQIDLLRILDLIRIRRPFLKY